MEKDRKKLSAAVKAWNESRLDLFAISFLEEERECHGVIRFYHQDSSNNAKYATKCVRVSSTASTEDVISVLAEKFRADMRMLTKPHYGLYEVHVDGETRKLKENERPLLVQLNWIRDDREGRFLLRNEDDKRPIHVGQALYDESEDTIKGFKLTRNLTKKEKKLQKKKEKTTKKTRDDFAPDNQPSSISAAELLYAQVPESTFTRTVSNPEAVMKKRREQKLQKRGAKVLKIYGDSLNPEIPYKTLLLLPIDKTDTVIRDALDKYGLGHENVADFKIVQVVLPPGSKPEECFEGGWGKETILSPAEHPLVIEQDWQPHQGTLVFQLRRMKGYPKNDRTSSTSREKSSSTSLSSSTDKTDSGTESEHVAKKRVKQEEGPLPKLYELTAEKIIPHIVRPNVTELGCDSKTATYGPFIKLRDAPGLQPSHCVITNMDAVVTVTPHGREGVVIVNDQQIEETTMLAHYDVIRLGKKKIVFAEPGRDLSVSDVTKRISAVMARSKQEATSSKPPHPQSAGRQRTSSADVTKRHPRPIRQNEQMARDKQHRYSRPVTSDHSASMVSSLPKKNISVSVGNLNHPPQEKLPLSPALQNRLPKLPASIALHANAERIFLSEVVSVQGHSLHFKLSPAYSIYLALRWLVKTSVNRVLAHVNLITNMLDQAIQMKSSSVSELSFWMANISELLNFLRQDRDLCVITGDAQDAYAKLVQLTFRHLVQCMQRTLFILLPAFLSMSDEDLPGGSDVVDLKRRQSNSEDPTMYDVLHMLSSAMSLLRKCRVNAALTIQLFSQLFHSINMWLFNKLVADSPEARILCSRQWGIRIRARLAMIETWAEKQGLELAADCHLARITQATHLLQAPKHSSDDVAAISGTCFKLNSLQLRALLTNYLPDKREGEEMIHLEMINKVVAVAENSADELTRSDGRDIQLLEDPDLQLPFLLPEDGYSCDVVHGVPSGLTEYMQTLADKGLCTYVVEQDSNGAWSVYFYSSFNTMARENMFPPAEPYTPPSVPQQPNIIKVTINKRGGGMGLSIVAAKELKQGTLGIYIRSIVKGGAADMDGRLQAGDQLVSVGGQSLIGVDQEKAASLMTRTPQTVVLQVAKQAAVYHGLATLINQPLSEKEQMAVDRRSMRAASSSRLHEPEEQAPGYQRGRAISTGFPEYQGPTRFVDKRGGMRTHEDATALGRSMPQLNSNHYPQQRRPGAELQRNNQYVNTAALQPSRRDEPDRLSNHSSTSMERIPMRSGHTKQRSTEEHRSPAEDMRPPAEVRRPFVTHVAMDNPNYDEVLTPALQSESERFSPPSDPDDDLPPPPKELLSPSPPVSKSPTEVVPSQSRATPPSTKTTPRSVSNYQSTSNVTTVKSKKKDKKQVTQQSRNKSSTLPRHFKSASPWERDEREKREQSIQEQLNALRDEEIEELTSRQDNLNPMESDRLKNLLLERDFQNRVQEERMKLFSDDDIPSEDFNSVPDRPDRDRLLRHQDSQAKLEAAKTLDNRTSHRAEDLAQNKSSYEKRDTEPKVRPSSVSQANFVVAAKSPTYVKPTSKFQPSGQESPRKFFQPLDNRKPETQAPHQATSRSQRFENEIRRRQERMMKQKEAEQREEAEREFLEQKLSAGKAAPTNSVYRKPSDNRSSLKKPSPQLDNARGVTHRENASNLSVKIRPISDGYMLGKLDTWSNEPESPPGKRPISYVSNVGTPNVIGSQEVYNDPRNRREANMRRESSKRGGADPSRMTFKDRQRMFQGNNSSPANKPRNSRKLLEIEENLRGQI